MPEDKVKLEEIQLVVFRLQDEEFAIDISQVQRIVRIPEITKVPEAPDYIEGVINLRGEVIAVIDLARQFELAPLPKQPQTARIIVAEIKGKTFGLLVDAVPELVRITKDQIDPTPEIIQTKVKKEFIVGVAKLGERLLILVDANKILEPVEIKKIEDVKPGGSK